MHIMHEKNLLYKCENCFAIVQIIFFNQLFNIRRLIKMYNTIFSISHNFCTQIKKN